MSESVWQYVSNDFCCSRALSVQRPPRGEMHTHDFIEIYYFISGDCTYVIEGTAYALKPHDILFKRPLEAHMLVVNSLDVPYERVGISIPIDLFCSLDPDNRLFETMMSRPLGTGNRFTAADFGHELCTEMMKRLADYGGIMERTEILSIVLFVASEAARVLRTKTIAKRPASTATQLIDYVNDHLFSNISLQSISDTFFISQSQINRLFKTHTGSTLGQYVTVKRLLTARERIASGVTATDACFSCGYNDYSAFYRAYTKHFGNTPQKDKR